MYDFEVLDTRGRVVLPRSRGGYEPPSKETLRTADKLAGVLSSALSSEQSRYLRLCEYVEAKKLLDELVDQVLLELHRDRALETAAEALGCSRATVYRRVLAARQRARCLDEL